MDLLAKNLKSDDVKRLITQGVDCNLAKFDPNNNTFIFPIDSVSKTDRHAALYLYEHRNRPTENQLDEHVIFYLNRYDHLTDDDKEKMLDYAISRLLYMRITAHSPNVLRTLMIALYNIDNASYRGENLCGGSYPSIALQLRIYTLFRKLIDMKIADSHNRMIPIVTNELLHNLATYYFLYSLLSIPADITHDYYKCIAKNVISKIDALQINEEYTIPTGWCGHAVCLSFIRINKTQIRIRVDNSASHNPPTSAIIVQSTNENNIIRPHVLGRLNVDHLTQNLSYFIELIKSAHRDLKYEEGVPLVYNLDKQICSLIEDQETDVNANDFEEQSQANCFVKCFQPGFRRRVGRTNDKLYHQILFAEKDYISQLIVRCDDEHKEPSFHMAFYSFFKLAQISTTAISRQTHSISLQQQLKNNYKQHYREQLTNIYQRYSDDLTEKYIPLHFTINDKSIELKNFFNKPRVLLLGDAGCGKSTLCQYAVYLWATDKLWYNQFKWVFYIPLRNLNSKNYPVRPQGYSLVDIIETECFQGCKLADVDKHKLRNQLTSSTSTNTLLWIVDGYDERNCPDHLYVIERDLLAKSNLLLTSRPFEIIDKSFDHQIRIQEFEHQDIKKYIDNYFLMFRQTAESCWKWINESQQLRETARIPACLEIICYLCDQYRDNQIFEVGMTMGQLYERMCEHLLRKYLLKFHRQSTMGLAGKALYLEPNSIAFNHLETLSFQATKSHEFIISGDTIAKIAGSSFAYVLQLGLLICKTRNTSTILSENKYHFVHRTFQEYLCARYMIRALSSAEQHQSIVDFINNAKYNRGLQNVFRLFFELERSSSCTQNFWSIVDNEPRDLIGIRHCSRIISWFPNGSCSFPDDEDEIDRRTTDAIKSWIKNRDRLAHDYGNTYLFEWFSQIISRDDWLTAWEEDLFIDDASKRRYFLPQLWSEDDIRNWRRVYATMKKNEYTLHRQIKHGPTKIFNLMRGQPETDEFKKEIKEKMMNRIPINTMAEFGKILEKYTILFDLNRQIFAADKEAFPLDIAKSALDTIDNKTLSGLLKRIDEDLLFFRYFKLPLEPLLKLYATNSNNINGQILRSLIVRIALSSAYLLIALSSGNTKFIRIFQEEKSVDIKMSEQRWNELISAFRKIRQDYGYSSFFLENS